jgi:hypothetical protein
VSPHGFRGRLLFLFCPKSTYITVNLYQCIERSVGGRILDTMRATGGHGEQWDFKSMAL